MDTCSLAMCTFMFFLLFYTHTANKKVLNFKNLVTLLEGKQAPSEALG